MKNHDPRTWLRVACVLAVIGLAFMTWSLVNPSVVPVLIALSVGQCIGTLSLALYLVVVIREYRSGRAPENLKPKPKP